MIDRDHDLAITRQAEALNISRGSVYYLPRPVSAADLALMRRIDELHLEFPFAGARMLRERWSRFPGQFGGLAKMDSGFDYAASFSCSMLIA